MGISELSKSFVSVTLHGLLVEPKSIYSRLKRCYQNGVPFMMNTLIPMDGHWSTPFQWEVVLKELVCRAHQLESIPKLCQVSSDASSPESCAETGRIFSL